jgi:hypothetical protein
VDHGDTNRRYPISLAVLLAGYGIPQVLGKFTNILDGVGVIETSMVGLYTVLGAPKTQRRPRLSTLFILDTNASRRGIDSILSNAGL